MWIFPDHTHYFLSRQHFQKVFAGVLRLKVFKVLIHLSPPVALAAARSKVGSVVVDLLLIVTPIVGFCNCSMFCCALLCVHTSDGEDRAGCFALFVFLVSHDCCVALPHDATGLFAICIVVFSDHTHYF